MQNLSNKNKQDIPELNNYSPHSLLSQAIAQNLDIDKLSKLMDLQERWEKNQARKSFFVALSKFQKEVPELKKSKHVYYTTKSGSRIEYNYTPISEISKQLKEPLQKNGFSYRWEFSENGKIKCTCIVSHVDGHTEASTMEAEKDSSGNKNDIQAIGSTRTYLQRYTLIGVLGLTTAEDDNDKIGIEKNEVIDLLNSELKTYTAPQDLEKVKIAIRDKYVKLGLAKSFTTNIIQDYLKSF